MGFGGGSCRLCPENLSGVCAKAKEENMGITRAKHIADIFGRNQDRLLFVDVRNDQQVTYGALLESSKRMASFLETRGVKPGIR
jgi:acyl-coenzyme A synthetase/AMP-(fatty) acid ligase